MRKLTFLAAFFALLPLAAQTYFQQEVNYRIEVKLDDETHFLHASETIEYINNSPDELSFLYFHLWPNAYKNDHTALAKQFVKNGSNKFRFASDAARGYIDSLNFTSGGMALRWEYDPEHIDICKIYLPQPLKPGGRISISTPFRVKMPGDFSRLGHVQQAYQVSQWYPKPAVYDHKGWHQMPYLDQGEFYSEFGSFEVKITVPKNYRVAATGELQEENERTWLQSLAHATEAKRNFSGDNLIPVSSKEFKTLTYKQDKVHDFAWFADKRFLVAKSNVKLASGRVVDTWAFFLPSKSSAWKNGAKYVDSAIHYYSKWVGEYPYSAASAVEGALSAGGGMEYPMVTVISAGGNDFSLDLVITHEVGHNWFYGILGSNERMHAWQDEGFNSYIENRYVAARYPDRALVEELGVEQMKSTALGQLPYRYNNYLFATMLASYGKQVPVNTKSDEMRQISYGLLSYMRTAALMYYLEKYLGQQVFDNCMHTYFDTWKFKHPYPEDARKVFETVSGKDLSWFFESQLNSAAQIDYKLVCVKKKEGQFEVTVKNTGGVNAPYPVQLVKEGKIITTRWIEGHSGTQTHTITFAECDRIVIDEEMIIPELDVHNNSSRTSGLFRRIEPLELDALSFVAQNKKTRIHTLPVLGFNSTDKFMLGAAFHNLDVQGKKFNYYLAPMYAFGQSTYSGNFILKYDFLRNGHKMNKLRLMGQYKRFAGYDKLQPSLTAFFSGGKKKPTSHFVQATYANIINRTLSNYPAGYQVARASYQRYSSNAVNKSQLDVNYSIGLENAPFQSIDARYFHDWKLGRKSNLKATLFAGVLIDNSASNAFSYYAAGSRDYMMNYYMTDRAANGTFGSFGTALVLGDQGGFRTYNGAVADHLLTAGLEYSRKGLFLSPYANIGLLDSYVAYDCGLSLNLGIARIYLPVAGTNFMNDVPATGSDWLKSVRFSFNLNIPDMFNNLDKRLDF